MTPPPSKSPDDTATIKLTRKKKLIFSVVLVFVILVPLVALAEISIRLLSPVEFLHPRYQYSPEYGLILFEDTRMTHSVPGEWEFRYTINENNHRGPAVPVADSYPTRNIVVLGDSYAFGTGVNDGEEFASRLGTQLGGDFAVINLGNPGWGLTQQIRRFYDTGRLYQPEVVVLQYCSNDLVDNLEYRVTTVPEDTETGFQYHTSNAKFAWVKKYLSRSLIQKSQLYNLVRHRGYKLIKKLTVKGAAEELAEDKPAETSPAEIFYMGLIERFAGELSREQIPLLMISVNGQLDESPALRELVGQLHAQGKLTYVEVDPWFANVTDYGSPEGHFWGVKGHAIVGEHLAREVQKLAQ